MSVEKNRNSTSRRNFIKQATVLTVGGTALHQHLLKAESIDKSETTDFGFAAQPVLANIDTDQVEVIVAPNDLAVGWVEYGEKEDLGRSVRGSVQGMFPTSDRVMRFQIIGLEPGREYFYRVHIQKIEYQDNWRHERKKEVTGNTYKFRTLDHQSATASFACWNDTHENEETITGLTGMLHEQRPDFLVWNGDVTNDIFREEQIVGQFLNPADQAYATSIPIMLSRGNHDVRGRDARHLRNYMTGPHGKYYYGFRQGPLACLIMDTGEDKPDDHNSWAGLLNFENFRAQQADWLAETVSQPWFTSAPYRVAFMHIPLLWEAEIPENWPGIWGDGIRGWICEDGYNKWHELLANSGIKLVISGHTHRHAYFPPNENRPYGQLIGGGPQPDRATCITGYADNSGLEVRVTNLEGDVLEQVSFI